MKNYMKACKHCGAITRRETTRTFVCNGCKSGRIGESLWEKIRNDFLELNPFCAVCGTTKRLNVHHLDGNPKNNPITNLETRCVQCHHSLHKKHDAKVVKIRYGLLGNRLMYE